MKWFLTLPRTPRSTRRVRLSLETLHDRIVPAIVINGTEGNDLITSSISPIAGSSLYHAEIYVNGWVAYAFDGPTWDSPRVSVFLPDQLLVNGLGGNDQISLGALRDNFFVSNSVTIVHGGSGDDVITGSDGHDIVYGDEGADRLNGWFDEDILSGDSFDLGFDGGGGVDVLRIEDFSGVFRATTTQLTMNGRKLSGADFIRIMGIDVTCLDGNDTVDLDQFPSFRVHVFGNGGNDTIRLNAQDGVADGGEGDDVIFSLDPAGSSATLTGGPGNDQLVTHAPGTLDGGEGDDMLDARNVFTFGTDGITAQGGPGNDTIFGSDFNDSLFGDDGDDDLKGRGGIDNLDGGGGADSLSAAAGDDFLTVDGEDLSWTGGQGFDSVTVEMGVQQATITNGAVTLESRTITTGSMEFYYLTGTDADDQLLAGQFNGQVNFVGLEGNDVLTGGRTSSFIQGNGGNDSLTGNAGDDYLDGGEDDDILVGGAGNDALFGWLGIDSVSGGSGDDYLDVEVIDALINAGAGTDTINVSGESRDVLLTDTLFLLNGQALANHGGETISLTGSDDADILDASAFSGTVFYDGRGGDDSIQTGSGNDSVTGGSGADSIFTQAGDDLVYADSADLAFDLGSGVNELHVGSIAGLVIVTNTSMTLDDRIIPTGSISRLFIFGTDNDDGINDTIDAAAFSGYLNIFDLYGDNTYFAGTGGSDVYSPNGRSVFVGGDGPDTITGGIASAAGGAGDDTFVGDVDIQSVDGGPGQDRVILNGFFGGTVTITDTEIVDNGVHKSFTGVEQLEIKTGVGDDDIDASTFSGFIYIEDQGGDNIIRVGSGGSEVHIGLFLYNVGSVVFGGAGTDFIVGGFGNDMLYGGSGDDFLYGSGGDDLLDGGEGNDFLIGHDGVETLLGGPGADTFNRDFDDAVFAMEQLLWDFNDLDGDTLV